MVGDKLSRPRPPGARWARRRVLVLTGYGRGEWEYHAPPSAREAGPRGRGSARRGGVGARPRREWRRRERVPAQATPGRVVAGLAGRTRRGGGRSHRRRVSLRQARADLARGAGSHPALHRSRGAARRRGQRGPQRPRARRARCCRWACSGRTRAGDEVHALFRQAGIAHRRHLARGRAPHAGEDAHHGRRLPGHAPAGGPPRPRAGGRHRGRPAEARLVARLRRGGRRRGRLPRLRLRLRHR